MACQPLSTTACETCSNNCLGVSGEAIGNPSGSFRGYTFERKGIETENTAFQILFRKFRGKPASPKGLCHKPRGVRSRKHVINQVAFIGQELDEEFHKSCRKTGRMRFQSCCTTHSQVGAVTLCIRQFK